MSSNISPESDSSQGGRYGQPTVSSDELLPPVEPPNAKFIIQLFVLPALIVAAVVLLWFVIESLARRGEQDPQQIVRALRSNNQARFQQAKELADILRLPQRYPELKVSSELAQGLAAYLDELVVAGKPDDADVSMRFFLATALGEFHVDDGLPTLIKTAQEDPQRDVRRRAINAIAVLADAMSQTRPSQPLSSDELTAALLALADDQDELVRSETAFALGVVASTPNADPRLTAKLEELADDPFTDARFNAAAGLARIGSPLAPAAVAEMLDVESIASSLTGEKAMTPEVTERALAAQKSFKRNTIVSNALAAIDGLLANKSLPTESFAPLEGALQQFVKMAPETESSEAIPSELVDEAKRILAKVKARTSGT